MAKNAKQNEHYVNNKEFTQAVAEFNEKVKLAESKGKTPPQMSNYMESVSIRLQLDYLRANFINYTYRDEMICDAIENCIQYIGNFNVEKSNNAFAYITQICYYAFLRRIQKEKKQVFIKQQMTMDITADTFETIDGDTTGMTNTNVEWMQENMTQVQYEPRNQNERHLLRLKV